MRASFRLGRIAGIEVGVHYTWLFAFVLIAWSLAAGFFPSRYPGWTVGTYWLAGIVSALLLFGSVLVHELAHSLVARAQGLPVQGITLFIFGGVSTLRGEAERAWDEFIIAIVGPLTSLVLAALAFVVFRALPDRETPFAASLGYLALINGLLAVFNLLPGFPLDGGRVLRSILWGATGSLLRATNIAAGVGQFFGWLLIAWGVFQVLTGNFLGGLWTGFIGWFLDNAASSSRQQTATQEIFRDLKVVEIMDREPHTVTPETTVEELVREYFLRRGQRAAPVCADGNLLGIVSMTDVKEVPQERWATTTVSEIMTREPLYQVRPSDDLAQSLRLMNEHEIHQVLVTEDGRLVGMLNRAHIIRYLENVQELGLRPVRPLEPSRKGAS